MAFFPPYMKKPPSLLHMKENTYIVIMSITSCGNLLFLSLNSSFAAFSPAIPAPGTLGCCSKSVTVMTQKCTTAN